LVDLASAETVGDRRSNILDRNGSWNMVACEIEEPEVNPDETLTFMLNYWHGWWRFMWHWHDENKGLHFPDLKMTWAHRKYCEDSWDKIGFSFTFWRLSLCFSCSSIKKSRALYRKMFPVDPVLSNAIIIEDSLDAEIIL